MLKKIIGILAAVSLVFAVSACNSNNNNVNSNDPSTDAPYEIQWYFVGNTSGQNDIASVQAEVNKYLKEKINATVSMNSMDFATYENRINMMLAGNEPLDLMFTTSWCANYGLNAAKNAFLPLNGLLAQYAPKTKALLGDEFLKGPEIDGKLYAVPANKDKAHNWGFVYRKDLAEKHGIDMSTVKNFEDLEPILKLIKEKEPGVTPLGVAGGRTPVNIYDFNVISFPDGFYADSGDDRVINLYETPEYRKAVDLARKFYLAGYVRKDSDVAQNFSTLQKEGAFFVSVEQCKPGKADELSASSKGFTFAQQDLTPPRMYTSDTLGSMMAIPRNSKNPARVMMFIELLNTDPYLHNLINFGIEGKHYTKTNDNTISIIKDGGYTQAGQTWQFGNEFANYLINTDDPNKYTMLDEFNKTAAPAKALGFNFDTEPVKTEVAACENVRKEFIMMLEVGTVDPNEYMPKFLDKLKQAGAEKIQAEMQKQYDAWKNK
jgi:putative aldouronate transport system substrate-binding protein